MIQRTLPECYQAITSSNNVGVQVVGTEYTYSEIRLLSLDEGRFIDFDDVDRKALNIVLGNNISKQLFPEESPIGKNVRISIAGGRILFNFRVEKKFSTLILEWKDKNNKGENPITKINTYLKIQRAIWLKFALAKVDWIIKLGLFISKCLKSSHDI